MRAAALLHRRTCKKCEGGILSRVRKLRDRAMLLGRGQVGEKMKTCNICYETVPEGEFTRLSCGHEARTECLQAYFRAMILSNSINKIRCPEHECMKPLPREEVAAICGEDLFDKYLVVEQNKKVMQDS